MSTDTPHGSAAKTEPALALAPAIETVLRHELHHLRSHWAWFLGLGCLLVGCGTLAIIFPATVGADLALAFLSVLLFVAGVAMLVGAFWTGKWSGFLVKVLVGIVYIAAGFVASEHPRIAITVVAIYVAVTFMVMGIFRMLAAMIVRFPQWGWTLLSGCVTFLTGLIIYRHSGLDAPWVIGLLVGLEMLFCGWTWIMLSLEIRRIPAV
jgi:uncharacterized membrane protein HdeD (DUF308 family)